MKREGKLKILKREVERNNNLEEKIPPPPLFRPKTEQNKNDPCSLVHVG